MDPQDIVDLLNEMHETDPAAIDAFMQLCTPVNSELADHPTVLVHAKNKDGDFPVLRPLGLLNAITAIDDKIIAANYDEDSNCLIGFSLVDKSKISIVDSHKCKLPNVKRGKIYDISAASQSVGYQLKSFNIPEIWRDTEGEGVTIAVLDTGCQMNHSDLKGSFTSETGSGVLSDGNGHGTHVVGTIAANNNSIGIVGVAPKAKIFVAKVLNNNGGGTVADVANGIHEAIDAKVDIISMSLGANAHMSAVHEAIKRAYDNNIAVVAAAGNSGNTGELSYPARYKETISVGALSKNKLRAEFSQTGNRLDFMAPGVSILSTIPINKYQRMSGTSMATPWMAGVAALIISKHKKYGGNTPVESVEQLREHLKRTAIDLGKVGKDTKTGFGLIDVEKAMDIGDNQSQMPEVVISAIQSEPPDKSNGNQLDEWIELINIGDAPIDLTGHYITDIAGWTYRFPNKFKLDVEDSVKIHIAKGTNTNTDLYWGYARPILNNDGDTIWVKNPDGENIAEFSY